MLEKLFKFGKQIPEKNPLEKEPGGNINSADNADNLNFDKNQEIPEQIDSNKSDQKDKLNLSGQSTENIEIKGEIIKEALPELIFTEKIRSKKRINCEDIRYDDESIPIENARLWNNYSIVTYKRSGLINIIDSNGDLVEDFKPPLNQKRIKINWYEVSRLLFDHKEWVVNDNYINQSSNVIKISNTPSTIKPILEVYLKNRTEVDIKNCTQIDVLPEYFDITFEGKYLIFFDQEKSIYFALQTQDENGNTLPPKNWIRIDSNYVGKIPQDLEQCVEDLKLKLKNYTSLFEKYTAKIDETGIKIFNKNNLDSKALFTDKNCTKKGNITVDSTNPNTIYYVSTNSDEIIRLDLTEEAQKWKSVAVQLPKKYENIQNLKLDPGGNFFLFNSDDDLVIITKDSLEEIKRIPGLSEVNFDEDGRIRAIDKDGYLVIYEVNFEEVAKKLNKRKRIKAVGEIEVDNMFDLEVARIQEIKKKKESFEDLIPIIETYEKKLQTQLAKITIYQEINELRDVLKNKFTPELRLKINLNQKEIDFVLEELEKQILDKEKELASKETKELLEMVRIELEKSLSITSISEIKEKIEKIKAVEAWLEKDLRQQYQQVLQELNQKSVEIFRQQGEEIIKEVRGLKTGTKNVLESFTSKAQMDDWLEFNLPQLKFRFRSILRDCPLEASEAYKSIAETLADTEKLAAEFEEKFKREYAKIREKASERIEATVDTLETDIESLIERLRSKDFTDRKTAEQYLNSSDARKILETEISVLSGQNSDIAKELHRILQVRISNTLTEIERMGKTQIAESGQQMILIGETLFPKFEAKVKEKAERKISLVFNEDPETHGPGIKADQILGDVAINIKGSTGKLDNVRLYENWQDENEWRLGLLSYRGVSIPPSYVSAAEYKIIKKEHTDWSKGEKSTIRKEWKEKRNAIKNLYKQRQKANKRIIEDDNTWIQNYQEKLNDYADFVAKHHIVLLKRIDHIKNEPEIEYTNGKGFVPEWQSHWVLDPQTEKDLEKMANGFQMQLDLQEGMLNLKGHAGTGKDVRIKMFCALSNRPYFGIDCTKWTTEFELSEDIILESENGASQTVKVPSAVLNGITTPGAIVYFNEFNAMTEQAQIFLHALMDEKRSLTLKTSSGKVIRALPNVLLVSSMNPNYPGTYEPQLATRSRVYDIEINYPAETKKPNEGDNNPNLPYDVSEALRMARGIDSLTDMTYEASPERNEFIKLWDKYINGIDNGSADPSKLQEFDLDTILAIVQFSNKLRGNFIKIYEKSRDARNALPVSQPITSRELRRCAWWLNKMTPEEKVNARPDNIARDLLEDFFLTHIDKKEDRDKIITAMKTWSAKKRISA